MTTILPTQYFAFRGGAALGNPAFYSWPPSIRIIGYTDYVRNFNAVWNIDPSSYGSYDNKAAFEVFAKLGGSGREGNYAFGIPAWNASCYKNESQTLDEAIAKFNAKDIDIDPRWMFVFSNCIIYFQAPQAFEPGSNYAHADTVRSAMTQWIHDNAPSLLDKLAPLIVLGVAGAAALWGTATTAATTTAPASFDLASTIAGSTSSLSPELATAAGIPLQSTALSTSSSLLETSIAETASSIPADYVDYLASYEPPAISLPDTTIALPEIISTPSGMLSSLKTIMPSASIPQLLNSFGQLYAITQGAGGTQYARRPGIPSSAPASSLANGSLFDSGSKLGQYIPIALLGAAGFLALKG